MIKPLLFISGLSFILVACSKEKIVKPTQENISGTYKLIRYEAAAGNTYEDYTKDCEKDNIYKLGQDSSYQIFDEGLSCSPAGNLSGKWWVLENHYLVIQSSYSPNMYTISKYDGKNLTLLFLGGTYNAVYYYQKQ